VLVLKMGKGGVFELNRVGGGFARDEGSQGKSVLMMLQGELLLL
jgi:hypothetical protein